MELTNRLPPVTGGASEGSDCRILAAYEDFHCGTVAKETCSALARSVARDVECEWNIWRLDVLGSSGDAFEEAKRANVLLLSVNGMRPMSEEVRRWLETIVPTKQPGGAALVGLFMGPSEAKLEMEAYQYLEEIADRARLAFFAQTFDMPRSTITEDRGASPRVQHLLWRTYYPSREIRNWGINE